MVAAVLGSAVGNPVASGGGGYRYILGVWFPSAFLLVGKNNEDHETRLSMVHGGPDERREQRSLEPRDRDMG